MSGHQEQSKSDGEVACGGYKPKLFKLGEHDMELFKLGDCSEREYFELAMQFINATKSSKK